MAKRSVTAATLGLSMLISGCGMNLVRFEDFPENAPFVVVSDGLTSIDARNYFKRLCEEDNVPYVGEDNFCWFKNKEAIEQAYKQGREIILIGYSAGCDQVKLTSKWCEEKGIPIHVIFFDPTYLQGNPGKSIPRNAKDIVNYLSKRNIPDFFSGYGKGREVSSSDLENRATIYSNRELRGTHLGIFDNNRNILDREIRTIIRNNYRRK
jgi:ribosomal protein L7Ae-like RNA K-turn-binding protein